MRKSCMLFGLAVAMLLLPWQTFAAEKTNPAYARLRKAEAFVAKSDKYLHQSKLRRGMTGYGLTVMAGTKIEKYNVTVISVMHNFSPHQDVILCMVSGLGLEKSGIIQGMSGSPIYIKDPANGKHKMVGALAYGWSFQKEPLCGIQPISQMLAIQGIPLPGDKPAAKAKTSKQAGDDTLDEDIARAGLNPKKIDFSTLAVPKRRGWHGQVENLAVRTPRPSSTPSRLTVPPRQPRLVPLATPIMVAGARRRTIRLAEKFFAGTGFVPMQAGAVGGVEAKAAKKTRLAPGSSVSIPMVTGDMDWSGVGTVTDIIDGRVLAFGHAMFGDGKVQMPMATAYVHTVVSSMYTSFKLGSTLKITGALTNDEYTGVVGRIGKKATMIPVNVTCVWSTGKQKYKYHIFRHRYATPYFAAATMFESVLANRNLPELHTVEYCIDIEYEKYGRYHAANISSGNDIFDVMSDLTRPLATLASSPLGKPVMPKSIDVTITIRPVQKTASILSFELDRNVYKPGEKVTGLVTLKPFRAKRTTKKVSITLPKDLPDGQYTLTLCDASSIAQTRQVEMPHRFRPRTLKQLFSGLQNVVQPRNDKMYLHLPLPKGGLAVKKNELEHLPASMAELLRREASMDIAPYRRSKTVSFQADCVISGSDQAGFIVKKHPQREQ